MAAVRKSNRKQRVCLNQPNLNKAIKQSHFVIPLLVLFELSDAMRKNELISKNSGHRIVNISGSECHLDLSLAL